MSKQSERHKKRYMIRAAEKAEHPIQCDVETVEWVQASKDASADDTAGDTPKRFKMRAYTGGPMQVGYYGAPVAIDLAGLTAKAPIPILLNHDVQQLVGHADEVTLGDSSLDLAGVISGASDQANQVTASAKLGFPWKASVGARPDKMEFVGEGVTTKVNGKTLTGPLYVARKSTLGEVSFVAMAADSKTTAKVAATAASSIERTDTMNEFEKWVVAKGFDLSTLTDEGKAFLKATFDLEQKPAPVVAKTEPDTVEAVRAAEVARIEAISAIPGIEKYAELRLKAIVGGWDIIATRLAVLEKMLAERPVAPAIHASKQDTSPEIIQAALLQTAGMKGLDKEFKPEVLEASAKMRGYGLQEAILACAAEGGYSGRQTISAGNCSEVLKAAFSTHTLTTLLTTTGNKMLLDGFNSMPQSWKSVAATRSVNDFKTFTAFRLTADLEYEEVGPAGEIKLGTVGQESYTMQAKTYAKMAGFTRQDIINDDLGALNDLRNRLGIGAAIKLNKTFWTMWIKASNDAAFWTGARGNLVTTASLAEAGLNSATKAFRDLKAPDGNMMSLEPDILLVPTDLEATARKFYAGQEVRDVSTNAKYATANIYYNRYRVVVIPELSSTSYTGYSATTWFLLANPAILASAAMCFLNGMESPTIESADADFGTLGIQFRGYHDFGCSMTEYRASVKATA